MADLLIQNASAQNLKHLTLTIPRNQVTVLSGVSGSGKSTLAMDVLFHECQRQYLEALGMQGIAKAQVEAVKHASCAILIAQHTTDSNNPRSTVGTMSDLYTDLRMIYEKVAYYPCPNCGSLIQNAQINEQVEKVNDTLSITQQCPHCFHEIPRLTRTHFSFNTEEGACANCHGLGEVFDIDEIALFQLDRSLEDGAVETWQYQYKHYCISSYYACLSHYGIPLPNNLPLRDFSSIQYAILLDGISSPVLKDMDLLPPKNVSDGNYSGIRHQLLRKLAEKGREHAQVKAYMKHVPCPHCHGEKLHPVSRQASIYGKRLPALSTYSLQELKQWCEDTPFNDIERQHIQNYLTILHTKLSRYCEVGLSYLTLDRLTSTLSGGEAQRFRLANALSNDMSGLLYILDEPTSGLHPSDTEAILSAIRTLKHHGNTILVIEHEATFLKGADHIIELGPMAGHNGGELVFQGSYPQLLQSTTSHLAPYLNKKQTHHSSFQPSGFLTLQDVTCHNLDHISVSIPTGGLIGIAGVSGSGKSTLIFSCLAKQAHGNYQGLDQFTNQMILTQHVLHRQRRSNIATYCDMFKEIRSIFASCEEAKQANLTISDFSLNRSGGRCEHCEGIGTISSNQLFFQNEEVICPICHGSGYQPHILNIHTQGRNIADILNMEVREAKEFFRHHKKLYDHLSMLEQCHLGYLHLNQPTTTLSGGEAQRLKLAAELCKPSKGKTLYLMDEPTKGLSFEDIDHILELFDSLTKQGNTIIVIEHDPQVLCHCDHLIELGPYSGKQGGTIIAQGSVDDIKQAPSSLIKEYL